MSDKMGPNGADARPENLVAGNFATASPGIGGLGVAWSLTLIVKLVIAACIPLAHDEAYYWVWGQHLSWSYFDHPPFVAWLFALGSPLQHWGNAVRWPAVLMGHVTILIWLQILKPHFDAGQLKWFFWLMVLSPLVGLGSLIVLPDLPLLFFWSLTLWIFLNCLQKPSLGNCLALGLSLGLGFSSKYHMVLFVPCAVIAAWRMGQSQVLRPTNLARVAVGGLIGSFPVWWWNLQNEFVSFQYQLGHGLGPREWKAVWPLEYAGGQFLLLFPPIVFLALRRKPEPIARGLQVFAWLPLAFFLLTSLRARVEANWPIIAFPSVFALAAMELSELKLSERLAAGWRTADLKWVRFTMAFWGCAVAVVLSLVIAPWVPIDPHKLKTYELYEYDELAEAVSDEPHVFADSYAMASQLTYKLNRPVHKLRGFGRVDFFDFIEAADPGARSFSVLVRSHDPAPTIDYLERFELAERSRIAEGFDIIRYHPRPSQDTPRVARRNAN